MFNLRKITCLVLTAAMVISVSPVTALADTSDVVDSDVEIVQEPMEEGEFDLTNEEDEILVTEDESLFVEDMSDDSALTDVEETEIITEENLNSLTSKQIEAKKELAAYLDSFDMEIPGEDYVDGMVYTIVDTEEEALEIADAYDITLTDYSLTVAKYELPEGVSVSDIIHIAADITNNYPAVYPNHIIISDSSNSNSVISGNSVVNSYSDDNFEEGDFALEDDDMSLASAVTDKEGFNDPYLNGNSEFYQWYHDAIGSPYAWAATDINGNPITGEGIKIAIVSGGISYHSDFTSPIAFGSKIPVNKNISGGGYSGYYNMEGFAMAGIIGADLNGEMGVGVAPGATLYNISLGNPDDYATDETIWYKALNDIYVNYDDTDIVVLDCAYNSNAHRLSGFFDDVLSGLYGAGIAVFAPMLENSDNTYTWPASRDHVIAVGATDKNNMYAWGTGNSQTLDLVAPGVDIPILNKEDWVTYCINPDSKFNNYWATAIAAGEAALILQDRENIKAFYNGDTLISKGDARVDALEKHMKASMLPNGKNKGIVYLPKALSLATASTAPCAPEIVEGAVNVEERPAGSGNWIATYNLVINDRSYDIDKIYYTIDGKKPSFKNGVKDKYSSEYILGTSIDIDVTNAPKILTINAIAVNSLGMASPVATRKVSLENVK